MSARDGPPEMSFTAPKLKAHRPQGVDVTDRRDEKCPGPEAGPGHALPVRMRSARRPRRARGLLCCPGRR
jgi:hypothetical protein